MKREGEQRLSEAEQAVGKEWVQFRGKAPGQGRNPTLWKELEDPIYPSSP